MTEIQNPKQTSFLQVCSTTSKSAGPGFGMSCDKIVLEVLVIEYFNLEFACPVKLFCRDLWVGLKCDLHEDLSNPLSNYLTG